jgi:hypothetical protein
MTTRFDSKDPSESVRVGFDYTRLGVPGNPDVQVTTRVGEDASPGSIKSGSAIVNGYWVYQAVIGGLDGVDYDFKCFADVGSERLLIDGILPVRAKPPRP